MQDELGFPDKLDANKWSVSELNDILQKHVVPDKNGCALHTFGCLEWAAAQPASAESAAPTYRSTTYFLKKVYVGIY